MRPVTCFHKEVKLVYPLKALRIGLILKKKKKKLKTLWEREKLLVTSNFSLSHSVFYLF